MSGSIVYRPHVHSGPPLFSIMNPIGTVWACDCGKRWTIRRDTEGRKTWMTGISVPRYSDDLDGALAFIRDEANRTRRSLGLKETP